MYTKIIYDSVSIFAIFQQNICHILYDNTMLITHFTTHNFCHSFYNTQWLSRILRRTMLVTHFMTHNVCQALYNNTMLVKHFITTHNVCQSLYNKTQCLSHILQHTMLVKHFTAEWRWACGSRSLLVCIKQIALQQ